MVGTRILNHGWVSQETALRKINLVWPIFVRCCYGNSIDIHARSTHTHARARVVYWSLWQHMLDLRQKNQWCDQDTCTESKTPNENPFIIYMIGKLASKKWYGRPISSSPGRIRLCCGRCSQRCDSPLQINVDDPLYFNRETSLTDSYVTGLWIHRWHLYERFTTLEIFLKTKSKTKALEL